MNPLQRMTWRLRRARRRGVRVRFPGFRPGRIVGALLIALCLAGMQDLRARGFGHPARTATIRSPPGAALNPFPPGKTLEIEVLAAQTVGMTVRDVMGITVRALPAYTVPAGRHRVHWDGLRDDGREAAPGIYTLDVEFGGIRSESRLAWIAP